MCVDEIKSTTGLFNASLGESGSETSGRAILAHRHLQGYTGDTLGAAQQAAEIAFLLALVAAKT